jgi:hypothetical protein
MRGIPKTFLIVIVSLLAANCREPFSPDFETGTNDYLVVEGYINVGQNAVTTIALSRLAPLNSGMPVFESGASVTIEDSNGTEYILNEGYNGHYVSGPINLDHAIDYRLRITTKDGRQYVSEFTTPKVTPPIDSVHWQLENGQVQLYVTTHDPDNDTRFYKWDYVETWEIRSDYFSTYAYVNGNFQPMTPPETSHIYYCWRHDSASQVHFASTTQFDNDMIHYPITSFGKNSERAEIKYSILVEQRALSQDEFNFLEVIQKNSSLTGSLFDHMPGEVRGNVQSLTNKDERVIGYVGAATTVSERIFIRGYEVGADADEKCQAVLIGRSDYGLFNSQYVPIDLVGEDENGDLVFTGAPAFCMDCTLRGSSKIPDFW